MESSLADPADVVAAEGGTSEVRRERVWPEIKYTGHLLGRFLKQDRLGGSGLILAKIVLIVASSLILLQMQLRLADATNALVARNAALFWSGLQIAFIMAVLSFGTTFLNTIVEFTLRMRMRSVYTGELVTNWLKDDRFYHLQMKGAVDHPEQRIQEDTFIFCQAVVMLVPAILARLLDIFLYSNQLWTRAPEISLTGIGLPYSTKGTMVVVAFAVGIGMTFIVHLVGNSLTRAEISRQRLEALYRAEMAEIRESAEAVAFEKGADIERERLSTTFGLIRSNWRWYTLANAKLTGLLGIPALLLMITSTALCAPFVMKGQMQIGDIQIVTGGFLAVYSSVSVIASNYGEIAVIRSAAERIRVFSRAVGEPTESGITVRKDGSALVVHDLNIAFPNGKPMIAGFSLELEKGDRLLVRGPSGAGKSTLLRTMAGLWPFGSGQVVLPAAGKISYLPQRSYMPHGTLAGLLTYPLEPSAEHYGEYAALLKAMDLDILVDRLGEHDRWRQILSPGQQQRIAAIRALIAKPDYLFLDEGTSALDPHSETILYTLLNEQLPNAAIISVAHRPDVEHFHDEVLEIRDGSAVLSRLSNK